MVLLACLGFFLADSRSTDVLVVGGTDNWKFEIRREDRYYNSLLTTFVAGLRSVALQLQLEGDLCFYASLLITRANHVGEYNTMHASLRFVIYNNHFSSPAPPLESGGY